MATRRSFLKGVLSAGTTGLWTGLVTSDLSATSRGIVGNTAPELEVDYWIDVNGEPSTFKLSENEGKWVFLKCFQSWCPGCHSHGFPSLKKISDALHDNSQVVFAGIQTVFEGFQVNTQDKVREIQLQYELDFIMGHDPGSKNIYPRTMRNYRTGGTPWMILINPQQNVIYNDFSVDADKMIAFLIANAT